MFCYLVFNYTDLVRQWKKDVKNALKDHIAWQNYVITIDSSISFQDFSNLYNKLSKCKEHCFLY